MILAGENERMDCGGRAFVEVLKQGSWASWGGKCKRRTWWRGERKTASESKLKP